MSDLNDARSNRDKAIERVEANASAEWMDVAYRAVLYVAGHQRTFISDDVWDALYKHYPHVEPREPRAMGAVLKNAVKWHKIELSQCDSCRTTKVMRPGRRAHGNATDMPEYRSRLLWTPS